MKRRGEGGSFMHEKEGEGVVAEKGDGVEKGEWKGEEEEREEGGIKEGRRF